MPGELEFAGVLLHQLFEAAEGHHLPERRVHSVRPGLGAEDFAASSTSRALILTEISAPIQSVFYHTGRTSVAGYFASAVPLKRDSLVVPTLPGTCPRSPAVRDRFGAVPGYSHPRRAALDYSSLRLSKEVHDKTPLPLASI